MSQRVDAQSGARERRCVGSCPGDVGDLPVPLTGLLRLPGPFERRGQLQHEGETLIDVRAGLELVEQVQCAQVLNAGVIVPETCRCLSRGEDRVVDRVQLRLCSGGEEM